MELKSLVDLKSIYLSLLHVVTLFLCLSCDVSPHMLEFLKPSDPCEMPQCYLWSYANFGISCWGVVLLCLICALFLWHSNKKSEIVFSCLPSCKVRFYIHTPILGAVALVLLENRPFSAWCPGSRYPEQRIECDTKR